MQYSLITVFFYIDPSCLFAEVILKSKSKDIEEINLYEPVGDKFLFNDLKVLIIYSAIFL